MIDELNEIAKQVHGVARSKGWYDSDVGNNDLLKNFVCNTHEELSELWSAYRSGNLHTRCDKADKMDELGIEPLTCIEEEMADVIIRVLDTAQALGIDIGRAVESKSKFNESRPYRHGGKVA